MKHKNSGLPSQVILIVFSVVITACIIIYFTLFYNNTIDTTNEIIEKSSKVMDEFDEYEITMYEFEDVKGSLVINYIKKNLGEYSSSETAPFYVRINSKVLGINYTNDYVNNAYIMDIKNVSAVEHYVNPNAYFFCEVIRNENKVIEGVMFTQK